MGSRVLQAVVLFFWLATMSWLVVAKVLPPLLVGEPPRFQATIPAPDQTVGWTLHLDAENLGWAASKAVQRDGGVTEVHSRVVMDELSLRDLVPPWLTGVVQNQSGRIDLDARTRIEIDALGQLNRFHTSVGISGIQGALVVTGRVQESVLDLVVRVGEMKVERSTRLESGALMNNEFSPLALMPGLRVGQTWTMQSYGALVSPNNPIEIVQATVEREDTIPWNGRNVKTLLVVYRADAGAELAAAPPRATLWVGEDGKVLQQETLLFNRVVRFVRMTDAQAEDIDGVLMEDGR